MDAILAEKPSIVETSGQSPKDYLPRLRGEGLKVMHKVPSVRFARKAQELGVDAVTVVGYECGGHPGNGEGTSMVQIRRAAQVLSIPLIAGGGIADGAGLAAALSLGADGVVMGTRFIAARECVIHPAFQQALCAASEEDTVLVQRSIGTPLRVWKNAAAQRVLEMEAKGASLDQLLTVISGALTKVAYEKGDVQGCAFPVGQCAGLIDSVIPAGQIIRDTVTQARELLDSTGEKL
ncbi:Nitronate monooxygenase [bioreactor metagenome]|uniref:Nitronate monooxygenase n=1 Tax=bioreactor metagenome TaxID=1076179 RepID=A0A645EMI8_9ZZZZ